MQRKEIVTQCRRYIAIKQSFAEIYVENNKETSTFLRIPVREESWLYGLCRTTLKVNYLGSFSAFLGIILCTCHINRVIETKLVKFEANLTSLSSSCSFLICSWRTCSASSRSCASLCKNGNIEKNIDQIH